MSTTHSTTGTMFHHPAHVAHPPDADLDADGEADHDMDIDQPSLPAAQHHQQHRSQQPTRNDQYTDSDAEADGDFEDDDEVSMASAAPSRTPYANGSAPASAVSNSAHINFAAVDPALYGLRRSVRCCNSKKKRSETSPLTSCSLSLPGPSSRGSIGAYQPLVARPV